MSNLIIEVTGNKTFNRTYWVPSILVYDDYILYRNRKFFSVNEISIPYKQVAQVKLLTGLFFADLEIFVTGNDHRSVKIRFAKKSIGKKAKKIIDNKIHLAHMGHNDKNENLTIKNTERALARLQELLEKDKISKKEFNQKKKDILNNY